MSEINWKQVAEQHQLTFEEFQYEVIAASIAALAMRMEQDGGDKVTVNFGEYRLELTESKND